MHARVRTFRCWDKFRGNSTASIVVKSHFIASISARIHARKNTRILNFVQNHVGRCVLMLVAKNHAPRHVHPAWRGVLGSANTLLVQFRAARSVQDCLVIQGAKEHCVVVIDARRYAESPATFNNALSVCRKRAANSLSTLSCRDLSPTLIRT